MNKQERIEALEKAVMEAFPDGTYLGYDEEVLCVYHPKARNKDNQILQIRIIPEWHGDFEIFEFLANSALDSFREELAKTVPDLKIKGITA